ncbi:hypothetical protein JCM11641_001544 [Rhodosporidiobolus odoratus]
MDPTRHRDPASAKKANHADYVKPIAAADAPLREAHNTIDPSSPAYSARSLDAKGDEKPLRNAWPTTEATPARSRRSRADRTPAQVKAVLTERKRRSSAGLMLKQAKELTPGGLLRALSRMPDLPPPTPEEIEHELATASPADSTSRRNSYIPKRSSLLAKGNQHPSSPFAADSPAKEETTDAAPPVFFPQSIPPSNETADTLQASRRLSRSIPQRPSAFSRATSDHEVSRRRSSIASVASVEAARRASVVPEDLSRFLVRRRRPMDVASEKGEESMLLDVLEGEGHTARYSLGPEGRFSIGSELGSHSLRDISFGHPDDPTDSPQQAPRNSARPSLASAYGDLSAPRLSLPASFVGDEGKTTAQLGGLVSEDDQAAFEQHDFGGAFDDEVDHFDGEGVDEAGGSDQEGKEEHPADRMPWEDKGKSRAFDDDGVEGDVWKTAAEGAGDGFGGSTVALPTPPPLAKVALNRKKRLDPARTKKQKKQRYTCTGEPIPDLPRSRQKVLFQHFLGPDVKMDESSVDALMDASQDFFAGLMQDATAAAGRAGRTSTVKETDMIRAMYDHHLLSSRLPLPSLARQLGVDRELQTMIDSLSASMPLDGLGMSTARLKTRRKKKTKRADEEEGLEDEDGSQEEAVGEGVAESEEGEQEEDEDEPSSPPPRKTKPRKPPVAIASKATVKRVAAKVAQERTKKQAKRRRSSGTSAQSKEERRAKKRVVASGRVLRRDKDENVLHSSSDEADVFSD